MDAWGLKKVLDVNAIMDMREDYKNISAAKELKEIEAKGRKQ